jgi:hypothetical protein
MRSPRGAKTQLIGDAIAAFRGEFTLGELVRACPGASREMIRHVLRQAREDGRVEALGRGPGARWRRKGSTPKRG